MYNNLTPKPTILTMENYGKKVTVEFDHSDLDINEIMEAFYSLAIGMGYHPNSFKRWVIEMAEEYNEEDK